MNFTYALKRPRDGLFGSKEKDGTWNGMIGEINRRESDMGKSNLDICMYLTLKYQIIF